jgi:hypothetical protein
MCRGTNALHDPKMIHQQPGELRRVDCRPSLASPAAFVTAKGNSTFSVGFAPAFGSSAKSLSVVRSEAALPGINGALTVSSLTDKAISGGLAWASSMGKAAESSGEVVLPLLPVAGPLWVVRAFARRRWRLGSFSSLCFR